MSGMLSLQEVMEFLGLDQAGVEALVRRNQLTAYNIGGSYVRFHKEQVMAIKGRWGRPRGGTAGRVSTRVRSWWDYYNVYVVTVIILMCMLFFAMR